jgi:hypothetical protein
MSKNNRGNGPSTAPINVTYHDAVPVITRNGRSHGPSTVQAQYQPSPISIPNLVTQSYYQGLTTTMAPQRQTYSNENMGYTRGGAIHYSSHSQPNQYQYDSIPQQHSHHPSLIQAPISPIAAPPTPRSATNTFTTDKARAASKIWSPQDDALLLSAHTQGLKWRDIARYFPGKTGNACRKRHERVMQQRSPDSWDAVKLENLAKEYMGMRKEIWGELARRTGEKWKVVEAKVSCS